MRHYIKIGILHPKKQLSNGYHIFSESDIKIVRFVQQAKQLGYTLKEILEILEESKKGKSPCAKAKEILQKRIVENHRRLNELFSLQKRMENALIHWEGMPQGVPSGNHICDLIEDTPLEE